MKTARDLKPRGDSSQEGVMASVGVRFSTQMGGTYWRTVLCQNCGERYAFPFDMEASGDAVRHLGLRKPSCQPQSEEQGRQNLAAKLEAAVIPVPCPYCFRLQPEMSKVALSRHRRWIRTLGIHFMVWPGYFLVLNLLILPSERSTWLPCGALLLVGWFLIALRRFLAKRMAAFSPQSLLRDGWFALTIYRYEQVQEIERRARHQGVLVPNLRWS
jgi:hypothetical protein